MTIDTVLYLGARLGQDLVFGNLDGFSVSGSYARKGCRICELS